MISIEVNGEARTVAASTTLAQLVDQLELGGQPVALAVNRSVVPRHTWSQHALLAQDKIEIVRAIGGG